MIEIKAEGGQVLGPRSAHPSGNHYEQDQGDFANVPEIPEAHAQALVDAARRLNEAPYTRQELDAQAKREADARSRTEQRSAAGGSVIDAYNAAHSIGDTLQAFGYTPSGARFARPGSESHDPSVTVDAATNRSFHHAANDPLSGDYWRDPFAVYCKLEHGDDYKAAVKAAAAELGMSREPRATAGHARDGEAEPDAPTTPELSGSEIRRIFREKSRGVSEPLTLAQVIEKFRHYLYLEDTGLLEVYLGSIAANLMDGDPVWLMIVGASGGGKTEPLNAAIRLPFVHLAATVTESSLLSGTPKKDKAKTAKGGLLREIGPFGLLLLKDFTSMLSQRRDTSAAVLSAFRELYDGSWTRHVGSDGGTQLHWAGKLAVIAGCTDVIDSHHAIIGTMGERFAFYRLPIVDDRKLSRHVLKMAGKEAQMRADLQQAVCGLFAGVELPETLPELPEADFERLIDLAALTARCRSAVERDNHTREIVLTLSPEAPTRIAKILRQLLHGMEAIGVDRPRIWAALEKIAFDSMHKVRRAALEILQDEQLHSTSEIARQIQYPTATARRALEELHAQGVLICIKGGQGKTDAWEFSDWAKQTFLSVRCGVPVIQTDDISSSSKEEEREGVSEGEYMHPEYRERSESSPEEGETPLEGELRTPQNCLPSCSDAKLCCGSKAKVSTPDFASKRRPACSSRRSWPR